MIVLGINAYHADSSAAIFVDGKMIAAIEEERFRRVKHWAGFPSMAVEFCLKEAGVSLKDVDHIAIGRDPWAKLGKKILFLLQNPGIDRNEIPSEMVTASGSGLDPHLSVAGAMVQVKRVAAARKMDEQQLRKLIDENTEAPLLGTLGTEKINILQLNLALDKIN